MSNGRYDVIKPSSVNITPADDWQTVAIKAFDKAEDRRVREESEARAQGNLDREREDNLFNSKRASAIENYESALNEYEIAINQIGKDSPEVLKSIQDKYSKEYLIPKRDGTYEKRYVVSSGVKQYTNEKIKTKKQFDLSLNNWNNMTPSEKIVAWPSLKRNNKYFNMDLTTEEEGYKRAVSFEDNKKVLESIKSFLPAGYSDIEFEGAKKVLLKDGEVSEAELKLLASNISQKITNQESARKFWTDFNTEIVKAMADIKLDTPPSVIANLQKMKEVALANLGEFYPGITGQSGAAGGSENEIGDKISQSLFGKNFNELTEEQMQKVFEEYDKTPEEEVVTRAGFSGAPPIEKEKEAPLEEQVKSGMRYGLEKEFASSSPSYGEPLGRMVKDPLTGRKDFGKNIAVKVRENPYKYAQKGIVPTEEFPYFKEVSVKEALMNWRESKEESMDLSQPIGIAPQPMNQSE